MLCSWFKALSADLSFTEDWSDNQLSSEQEEGLLPRAYM